MIYLSDKTPLEDRLKLVIRHYIRKTGHAPEFIVLNDKVEFADKFDGVDILKRSWIMKNNFWVGVYG
ncbi:MAG: hypothetical protein LLF98_06440 [Clostridium sp.]|jgi:hypothetical protein|uniref:hypothetical protein n=1 Tax=Clostridium sp. TaxID=1506 RepID=UPI0025BB8598|nr:hypothetical protein [Clostridium sp.]MCE5220904.1 hypothetical protein [Clostridium sp.]